MSNDVKVAKTIADKIDQLSVELRKLSLGIHEHPELRFEEKYAHEVLTKFMESKGFKVTPHYKDLDTAWLATFKHGSGGRNLGFNSEMDALPGIGHACGHNLIAIGGVAAALGVAEAMKEHDIAGTVTLLGTPAEEGGNGKCILLERGAYEGIDACLMIHPCPGPENWHGAGSCLARAQVEAEYIGHTAHAAFAPWDGRNALDAAVIAYNAISVLRQQIKPTSRVHGSLEGRDWTPNVVPDYAKMSYYVRTPRYQELNEIMPKIKNCLKAGALATSCEIQLSEHGMMYDLLPNNPLAEEYKKICEEQFGQKVDLGPAGFFGASTDFGNVTHALPGLHPVYAIPTKPGGGNHNPLFTAAAATPEAHAATLIAAKSIAITGMKVLTDAVFAAQVTESFKQDLKRMAEEFPEAQ
ncbi:amidohydrolase [Calocera viscosa TUFC12733]|uniref:Peptidase M20 domain-containing protein 2 n=1 Tax=Calocera viscosa (strain TUFC12733) TaxID=1330018 RepID=A0A167IIU6_CALVF|nr:amidohydrolase [Calocera viscosa TUFC12733]